MEPITTRTVDASPYYGMAEVLEPFVAFEWSPSFLSSVLKDISPGNLANPEEVFERHA